MGNICSSIGIGLPRPATTAFAGGPKPVVPDRIQDAIAEAYDGDTQMIDGPSVRVHHAAANSKDHPDRCMARSRGELTTRIPVLTDAKGLPTRLSITPGQEHDGSAAAA